MLKSSFSPAGDAIAVTIPSAMSSTCVIVRVCSPEPKISQRAPAGERLVDQVGHRVRDPRLVGVGQLAGAVGVERPADRVAQAVLRRGRRACRPRRRASRTRTPSGAPGSRRGAPRWSGTRSRARTPSRRTRTRSRSTSWSTAAWTTAPVSALLTSVSVNGSLWKFAIPPTIAARWITCEQPSTAACALGRVAQVGGVDLAPLAHPQRRPPVVGDPDLPLAVGEQPPDDGRADRPGAAGDQHAAHPVGCLRRR